MAVETRWVVAGQWNRVRYIPSAPSLLETVMDRDSPRCRTAPGQPLPIVCPAPQSWAHSTHPAGTDDQPGGSPKGVGVFSAYRVGPDNSVRACSEYPNSGLRSEFLFVRALRHC